ncbi:uncharacterized protein LOC131668631 [Phymastichus coffea]|uniref:uncharacterized protein LOC131668631 n=1 Tax=Phymastichus coffea TaxID=108790 RepID=UPI00273CD412|nr:uncharacterized protein LOC131668631 [Phymastichus coffea]
MKGYENKFTLSNDQATALELLRLEEAAQLANDQLTNRRGFTRNDKLSHVVYAVLNASQFLTALTDEAFHHLHHAINRKMRKTNPNLPSMPEERNPIFFVYPICMGISFLLFIGWLCTKIFNRRPLIALMGNGLGGILIIIGGIWAMRHAEKHINLNEVSDEELLTHPIFIHNFVLCIVSIFGMILYFIPAWILLDAYMWQRKNRSFSSGEMGKSRANVNKHRCTCSRSKSRSPRPTHSPRSQKNGSGMYDIDRISISPLPSTRASTQLQGIESDPVILYCCCVDCHRYLKAQKRVDKFTHEFQVIQVM